MENISSYISEKLIIHNDSKSSVIDIDTNNKDLMIAIIKSIFISIYKNRTYKIKGLSHYSIKRSEINWEDVAQILKEEYNFSIDKNDIIQKNGKLQSLSRKLLNGIEDLINMKSLIFKIQDTQILISGKDIYWKDWVEYRKKYNLQGY